VSISSLWLSGTLTNGMLQDFSLISDLASYRLGLVGTVLATMHNEHIVALSTDNLPTHVS
jgi:hypothetical protein